MLRSLLAWLSFWASLGAASAASAEPTEDSASRSFLAGSSLGSHKNPEVLADASQLARLCELLADTQSVDPEWEMPDAPRKALNAVYLVRTDPTGFRFPLKLDRGFVAMNGALIVHVMGDQSASFSVSEEEARTLRLRYEARTLALRITFQLDDDESFSPCASYPKSAAYSLRIHPLSFQLVGLPDGKPLATLMTGREDRLKAWLRPGPLSVRLSASASGPVDPQGLQAALEAERSKIEACLAPLLRQTEASFAIGWRAVATPQGAIRDLSVEMQAADSAPTACVESALSAVNVPRAGGPSEVHLLVMLEHDAS